MRAALVAGVLLLGCGGSKPTAFAPSGSPPARRDPRLPAAAPERGAACAPEQRGAIGRWGAMECYCDYACSGAELESPRLGWQCIVNQPECPPAIPADGSPCPRQGVACIYAPCPGTIAGCGADLEWDVRPGDEPA